MPNICQASLPSIYFLIHSNEYLLNIYYAKCKDSKKTKCRHDRALAEPIICMRRLTLTGKSNYMLNYHSDGTTENWHNAL